MESTLIRLIALVVALMSFSLKAAAEEQTKYVTDHIRFILRSGPSKEYRVLGVIETGTAVAVFDTEDNFSHVKLPSGEMAWIESRFLESNPIAKDRLRELESSLAEKRAEIEKSRRALEQELSAAKADSDNSDMIRTEHEKLKSTLAIEQQKNRLLKSKSGTEKMVTGAIIMLGGVLLGVVLSRLKPKRRSSSWSD